MGGLVGKVVGVVGVENKRNKLVPPGTKTWLQNGPSKAVIVITT